MNKITIGIDCGANGAMCFLGLGEPIIHRLDDRNAIYALLSNGRGTCYPRKVFMENIDPRKRFQKANIESMRKLSENFGYWKGVLTALEVPFELVDARIWQAVCGIRKQSKYDYADGKQLLWNRAKQLYPDTNIFKYAADAVLIAHYGTLRT